MQDSKLGHDRRSGFVAVIVPTRVSLSKVNETFPVCSPERFLYQRTSGCCPPLELALSDRPPDASLKRNSPSRRLNVHAVTEGDRHPKSLEPPECRAGQRFRRTQ